MKPTPDRAEGVEGVVTARTCDCCGHHEIGIVSAAGEYVRLQPGMRVIVVSPSRRGSGADSD